jgi:hypothetical protein
LTCSHRPQINRCPALLRRVPVEEVDSRVRAQLLEMRTAEMNRRGGAVRVLRKSIER